MSVSYYLEFELSFNSYTDLAADWHSSSPLTLRRGIPPGERAARVGELRFSLYNPDGRYSPGLPGCRPGFELGIGVRLRASLAAQDFPLFYGRLAECTPCPDGSPVINCRVLDDMAALARTPLGVFPLTRDVSPGPLIQEVIRRGFTPPGRADRFRLGHPVQGRLGPSARLSGPEIGVQIAQGQSRFPWVGDGWKADQSLLSVLEQIVVSEGGWFYLRADGTPVFVDRHYRIRTQSPAAEFDSGLSALHAERNAARLANRVEVTVYPREEADSPEILWTSGSALRVPPGTTRTILASYQDPQALAEIVAALDVNAPLVGWSATSRSDPADPKGISLTHLVHVSAEIGATATRLRIQNEASVAAFIHGLSLSGRPLRAYQPLTAIREDEQARMAYGLRLHQIDMPLQDSAAVAADSAGATLANLRAPQPWLTLSFQIEAAGLSASAALARDVGDRITMSDAALGLDRAACFIEEIEQQIQRGPRGLTHRLRWFTIPADLYAAWILGSGPQSRFGTRLAY